MPSCRSFGPGDTAPQTAPVTMTLDEFETVRLIDLEGLTQEQCAGRMSVARTTVQAIYNSARMKLAECLVNGRVLFIGGGDVFVCDGSASCCGCARRRAEGTDITAKKTAERTEKMKIAATYDNGEVFQHFGHTEQFKLYEVEDGRSLSSDTVNTDGSGHGALASLLKGLGADALICGGIGAGARSALDEVGITVYGGVTGSADKAAQALAAGTLSFDPNASCSHHGEHHHGEHSCGDHGCGNHGCGGADNH